MICLRCGFGVFEHGQRVVVALRHLFAVGAGHAGRRFEHVRLGQHEHVAELMVEAAGDVAADFDVLHLVGADGHGVAVVGEDVGRLQHGVREQAGVGGEALGDFVFVGDAPFEQAHRRAGQQDPAQLADFGHVGLHEQRRLIRIEPERQQVERHVERILPQLGRVADRVQRVQVGDEVKRLLVVLQGDVLADRAEVIAPVDRAGRLDAAENFHDRFGVSLFVVIERADNVRDTAYARGRQRCRQRIEHFHRGLWIVEVHGAELNRRCAGDEEFHHIVDRGDAADADDRRFRLPGRPGKRPAGRSA